MKKVILRAQRFNVYDDESGAFLGHVAKSATGWRGYRGEEEWKGPLWKSARLAANWIRENTP